MQYPTRQCLSTCVCVCVGGGGYLVGCSCIVMFSIIRNYSCDPSFVICMCLLLCVNITIARISCRVTMNTLLQYASFPPFIEFMRCVDFIVTPIILFSIILPSSGDSIFCCRRWACTKQVTRTRLLSRHFISNRDIVVF